MVAIDVPPQYGWVILGAGIGSVFTNFYLSSGVMSARTKYDVQFPHLYAVPGFHKNVEEFNRVQRSHQNFLEGLSQYVTLALIGGLKYPVTVAIASAVWCAGSILYQMGYTDASVDVKVARYKKGGPVLKLLALAVCAYASGAEAFDLIKSA
eukprot:Nitzschia sp. Nitz4//scaffold3_size479765//381888//382343//NITZ4_000163-RA/size479765-processed-gene-1.488-mRNA-1//1//CDS//3329550947//9163//frame0